VLAPQWRAIRRGSVLREKYRLMELLGEGAHGLTFLAHHEFLNHPCVVKLLPERIEDPDDAAVRRLRNEASEGFRINHANVVRVLDGGVAEGIWYFVMEYVEGADLAAVAEQRLSVDWRQALRFAQDAVRGLDAIHSGGLVHLDVKPGNLLLGADGAVRIADLGVARLVRRQSELGEAHDRGLTGTLSYAAPEALGREREVGPAADLYSLGATLFELLTGQPPQGGSPYRTLLRREHERVTWPEETAADVPEWFRNVILELLSPRPEDRGGSARDVLTRLTPPGKPPLVVVPPAALELPVPRGLVVLPFENRSGTGGADDWIGSAVADHLGRALAQQNGAFVPNLDEYLQTLRRIEEREERPRGAQLQEAGRLSGAAHVVEGAFAREGEQIKLWAWIHSLGQEAPVEVEPRAGALLALAELERYVLERLVEVLELPTAGGVAEAAARRPANLAAEERLFTSKRAFFRGDYASAFQLAREAVALEADFADAVGLLSVCCARMGDYEQASHYHQEQLALADRKGDERLRIEAYANLATMHYYRGEYAAALEQLRQAASGAERLGLVNELALIRNNLGFVLLQLDYTAEAAETFQRAIDTHKRNGALTALIAPYHGLGNVLREQRQYDEARDYFQRALGLARECDDVVNIGVAYMNLGRCALLQGRLADAKHELAIALNVLERTSFWNGLARVYQVMAELNLRLSDRVEAGRCSEELMRLARRHANRRMEAAAWRLKAAVLRQDGRSDEAANCEETAELVEHTNE